MQGLFERIELICLVSRRLVKLLEHAIKKDPLMSFEPAKTQGQSPKDSLFVARVQLSFILREKQVGESEFGRLGFTHQHKSQISI